MPKYIKLGKKAESFYDPTSKTKVLKGRVVELNNSNKFSKRIQAALRGGHLEYATEEEFSKASKGTQTTEAKTTSEVDITDEKVLKKLKKPALVELALEHKLADDEGELYTKEELEEFKVNELVEMLLDLNSEEDEDEEEE